VPYNSPFLPALEARGAVRGALGDVLLAVHFGDAAKEVETARRASAAIDLAWRAVIVLRGRDRARFLHGMCTNEIKKLAPGDGRLAAVVNRQGKMVGEIVVHATQEALLLATERSNAAALIEHLARFVVADDVSMAVSDAAVIGLYGPSAPALLGMSASPPYQGQMREGGVYVAADPTLPVPGFTLIVPAGREGELDRLLAHGVSPLGFDAWERLRIENGFPRWGADMGPDVLPMEAGLEPLAIRYDKGCYIGQEVIQRVKTYSEPPKSLVQLAFEGEAPAAGAKILAGAEEVGQITSATPGLALGYVRKEQKAPGTRVMIAPATSAGVRALPWHARL
jgi:folate-binding protein YgfZ